MFFLFFFFFQIYVCFILLFFDIILLFWIWFILYVFFGIEFISPPFANRISCLKMSQKSCHRSVISNRKRDDTWEMRQEKDTYLLPEASILKLLF